MRNDEELGEESALTDDDEEDGILGVFLDDDLDDWNSGEYGVYIPVFKPHSFL